MVSRMTDGNPVQVPRRYARVNARVVSRDTDAEVRFLTSVLDAVETPDSRMLDPDGDIGHVEVKLGDSAIMLFDARPGLAAHPRSRKGLRQRRCRDRRTARRGWSSCGHAPDPACSGYDVDPAP